MKIKNVFTGWLNYIFENEDVNESAKEKAKICFECPEKVKGSYEKLMPDFSLVDVEGFKCNKCGCPLSTKLRSDDKCPLDKFKNV